MLKKIKESKVKSSFTVNNNDLSTFKEIVRAERSSMSIVLGQLIHRYIKEKEGERNAK